MWFRRLLGIASIVLALASSAWTQAAVEYRLSFPNAVHHVMQVEALFRQLPAGPLRVQMSRSSPGRYSAVEFARNVYEVRISDGRGNPLAVSRPDPRSWEVKGHHGTVAITYNVFGDRVDGTFIAIDATHARINMPAALMWAPTMAGRPARVVFVLPPHSDWKVATQLFPTQDPLVFTAPNLPYLMDSPAELSNFVVRSFRVAPLQPGGETETIRVAMHYQGSDADLDTYVAGFQKTIREEQAVFGELPRFEPGYYTLIADYLPWAAFDGMEHRNSSMTSSSRTLLRDGIPLVGSPTHEFFHVWNVRRIRPASLEPFNFNDVDASGELWLAEGFSNYYERLMLVRSGIRPDLVEFGTQLADELGYVLRSPGGKFRSAVDMSRLAPFTDTQGEQSVDTTDWPNTAISYYSLGDMIALGLDLTLRARSDSRISLDDFMREMWKEYGKPGGRAPGLVSKPYTLSDVRACLARVSGERSFADDFMRRYVEGTQRIDYAPLLLRAGFLLRNKYPGRGTLGDIVVKKEDKPQAPGLRVASPTIVGTPAYLAGLDLDDELISVAGVTLASPEDLTKAMADRKSGDEVELVFLRRGQEVRAKAQLAQDPELEIIPVEKAGGTLSEQQRRFRSAWLDTKVKTR